MANESDAFGKVTIFADDKEALINFMLVRYLNNKDAYYQTNINTDLDNNHDIFEQYNDLEENIKPFNNDIRKEFDIEVTEDIKWFITKSFVGNGRWSFSNNINWFFDGNIKEDTNFNLKKHHFFAYFDYKDSEPGCDYVTHELSLIEWTPGENEKDGCQEQLLEETIDHGDYSAKNLVDFGFYSENEVFDTQWIIENPGEFKKIVYNYQKPGDLLNKYFDLAFEQINNDQIQTYVQFDESDLIEQLEEEFKAWLEYERPELLEENLCTKH